VILDMIMPGLSGAQTFEELKEINPEVKVLLSSGYSLNGQAEAIMKKGCRGFLQKPFNIKELSATLQALLDSR
jgi:two-component system, cell cycle sensor histidine kinase and response regulator CckA